MQFTSLILSNVEVSPGYWRMRMTAPPECASARPGQFIMVRVTGAIDPLLRRGLRLDFPHELPYTVPGLPFSFLEKDERGMLRVKGHREDFPLTFTLKMTKETP